MTVNFYHTNNVVPNTIIANKELFMNTILTNEASLRSFIENSTYNKACSDMGEFISNSPIIKDFKVMVNANGFKIMRFAFFDAYASFNNDSLAIAIFVRKDEIRYFIYEIAENEFSINEIMLDGTNSLIKQQTLKDYDLEYFDQCLNQIVNNSLRKVKVGVSNRHVHLCQEDLDVLFGKNYQLTFDRALVQTGEFAAKEKVDIKTEYGEIIGVRVLGPIRDYTQVEISRTDSYKLKINPPIRESGDLKNAAPITIIGPNGVVNKESNCIIANRHIHVNESNLLRYDLDINKTYMVRATGEKGGILDNVHLKLKDSYMFELHIDTDDANAFMIKTGDELEIIEK